MNKGDKMATVQKIPRTVGNVTSHNKVLNVTFFTAGHSIAFFTETIDRTLAMFEAEDNRTACSPYFYSI